MKILSSENIAEAIEILQQGGTLVFPTETTYGLGCDATNQQAVNKIFQIKNRLPGKTFLVVVPSAEMAKEYLEWNENIEKIARSYWPGAVTVVGKVKDDFFVDGVVTNERTIALRVTDCPWLQKVSSGCGLPLVATSANVSGDSEIYDFEKIKNVFSQCEHQPDAIVDAGELPHRAPTTIVDVTGEGIKILRQGEIEINLS